MVIWSVACVALLTCMMPRCDAIADELIRCVCVDDANDTIRMFLFVQTSMKYFRTMRRHNGQHNEN